MKMNKFVFLVSLILISTFVRGQTSPPPPVYDTTTVPVMYITDSVTFATKTGWAKKITVSNYQFVQTSVPQNVDSFTVKKTKVPISAKYYADYGLLSKSLKSIWKEIPVLVEFRYPQ